MKNVLIALSFLFSFTAVADQLAYISKAEADKAAAYIMKHKTIYLFCGCCSIEEPKKIKVKEAVTVFTGYEGFYEVEIIYENENGETVSDPIDLAYVWTKKLWKYKTLGTIFAMEHDYCVYLKDWDDPKNLEKDI